MHVLDTDTFSLYRHGHALVNQRVGAAPPGTVGTTVVNVEELLTGWYRVLRVARRRDQLAAAYQNMARTVEYLAGLRILPFPVPAILRFEQLRAMRLNIGGMDLRIAAIVLEHGAVLVTRNRRDFGRVPGLVLEDWSV